MSVLSACGARVMSARVVLAAPAARAHYLCARDAYVSAGARVGTGLYYK